LLHFRILNCILDIEEAHLQDQLTVLFKIFITEQLKRGKNDRRNMGIYRRHPTLPSIQTIYHNSRVSICLIPLLDKILSEPCPHHCFDDVSSIKARDLFPLLMNPPSKLGIYFHCSCTLHQRQVLIPPAHEASINARDCVKPPDVSA
jgi:hypothetical protein